MTTLARLARVKGGAASVLLTTVNASVQRVPAKALVAAQSLSAAPGNAIALDGVVNGRAQWVSAHAHCARHGRVCGARRSHRPLPPGLPQPIRLDFFGDTLEIIRSFDP